ncbi:MAG: OmpA family protein [Leptospira sp.]|nr:OmpA family protein [Leptospira sp.]
MNQIICKTNWALVFFLAILTFLFPVLQTYAQEGFIFDDPYKRIQSQDNAYNRSIYFQKGSDKISKSDQLYLQDLAKYLTMNPDFEVYILAHAFEGKSDQNDFLVSEKRSLEVERFLKIHFVNESQIQRLFYGNSKIKHKESPRTNDSFHRRVELVVGNKNL